MAQKQGEGKIDWTDWTWNPIKGKCGYNCEYCYMHDIRKRFKLKEELRLDEKELEWNPPKMSKVFVCSSLDIMHRDIPDLWIDRVIGAIEENPDCIYQVLSKNPPRLDVYEWPSNAWLGATFDGLELTMENVVNLAQLDHSGVKFISFEPLLSYPTFEVDADMLWAWEKIDWMIIGADSRRGAKKPPFEWAARLMEMARETDTAVWVKDNYPCKDGAPGWFRPKEFPKHVGWHEEPEIEIISGPKPAEVEICE